MPLIEDRDAVRVGDRVVYGSLGYRHEGVAVPGPDGDDDVQVNNGYDWYSNFIRAVRAE